MASLLHTESVSGKTRKKDTDYFFYLKQARDNFGEVFKNWPTFVVKDALHLHAAAGVGDTEHGTGHQALQGWGTVRGPHQAPVRLIVEPL